MRGPTPPGTGVIAAATRAADSKSTSPTRRPSTTLMPTSTTTAPGLSMSPVMRPGRPAATTTTSAVAQVRGEVRRARVADRDRGVLAQEQEGGGLADDVGAADDDGAAARQLHPGALEELDRRVGGGRQEAVVAEGQEAGVQGVDAVDVLRRVEGVDDDPQRDRGRQRLLDDDAGDRALGAEGQDLAPERLGGAVVAELHEPILDPDQAAAVEDLVQVDGRGGVAADDDDGELRGVPVLLA